MGFKQFKERFESDVNFAREIRKKARKDETTIGKDEALFGYLDLLCCTLFEINGNLDSLAMSYTKMLKIQEARDAKNKKTETKEA